MAETALLINADIPSLYWIEGVRERLWQGDDDAEDLKISVLMQGVSMAILTIAFLLAQNFPELSLPTCSQKF